MLRLSISSRRPAATLAASSCRGPSRKLTCLTHGFKEIEAWKKRRREADGRNRIRKSASDSHSPVQVPSSPLIGGPDTAIAKSTGRTATATATATSKTSTTPTIAPGTPQTVSQPARSKITLLMDYSSFSFAPPPMVIRVGPFKLFEERMIGPPGVMSSASDVVKSTKKSEGQGPQGPAVEDGEEEGPAGAKQQRSGEIAPAAAPPLKVEWQEQKTARGITTVGMNRELPLFLGGGGSF